MKFVFLSGVAWNSCLGGRTVQLARVTARTSEVHFVSIPSLRGWRVGKKYSGNIVIHTLLPKADKFPFYARRYLEKEIGLNDACVIVSNPAWAPIVAHLKAARIIYDHLDYFAIHAPGKKNTFKLENKEKLLLEKADLITSVSQRLFDNSPYPEKTELLPNAVPGSFLTHEIRYPEKPVIGFHGALFEWVDYDLLEKIADAFPDCTLRLAGIVRDPGKIAGLRRRQNVEFLPEFQFEQLPEIINGFSIGLIPFKNDEVSRCADPLKTYEYLSMGRCVVSTVPSFVGGDVFSCVHEEKFLSEISRYLTLGPQLEKCRKEAAQHTWEIRSRQLFRLAGGIR